MPTMRRIMKTAPPMNQASCHIEGHARLAFPLVTGVSEIALVNLEDSAISSVDIGGVSDVLSTGISIRHDPLVIDRYETTGSVTSAT